MAKVNGTRYTSPQDQPPRRDDAVCIETKGRELIADMVSEAVDEAFGLITRKPSTRKPAKREDRKAPHG